MSRTAFVFPGQGAQHVGMGRSIAETVPAARELYDRANEILGYDLARVCFEGPVDRLDSTVISQPALLVTSLAAVELLRVERPEVVESCELAAGLSLGEYTALVFAGVMQFDDALAVVACRGEAMQEASARTPSGMVSLLLIEPDDVAAICRDAAADGLLEVANFLCPGNLVVSGDAAACARAMELAEAAGGRAVELAVAGAFHTRLMEPADRRVAEALAECPMSPPRIPVVSNVDAMPHHDVEEIRQLLVQQVVRPVRWEESMRWLLGAGADRFYEVGPGRVLRGILKRIERKVSCETVNDS